jgi:hypothetical protein
MADQGKLRDLQKALDQKIKIANEINGQMAVFAKKDE